MPAGDVGIRIRPACTRSLERVGSIRSVDLLYTPRTRPEARGIIVGYVSKGRLSTKLEIQGAIFDVIENAKPTAHHQLPISQHVPSEAKAGSKVIVIGIDDSAIRRTRVLGV